MKQIMYMLEKWKFFQNLSEFLPNLIFFSIITHPFQAVLRLLSLFERYECTISIYSLPRFGLLMAIKHKRDHAACSKFSSFEFAFHVERWGNKRNHKLFDAPSYRTFESTAGTFVNKIGFYETNKTALIGGLGELQQPQFRRNYLRYFQKTCIFHLSITRQLLCCISFAEFLFIIKIAVAFQTIR